MKTKLNDIHITPVFKHSYPSDKKLLKCMTHFAKYRKLDRDIVLDENNILVDGYVGYLTLMKLGIKKWKYIKDNSYQWYVQGKHNDNGKTYTWKLPDWLMINGSPSIHKGERYMINTSQGISAVKITKVFISNKSPIDGNISNFVLV